MSQSTIGIFFHVLYIQALAKGGGLAMILRFGVGVVFRQQSLSFGGPFLFFSEWFSIIYSPRVERASHDGAT